MSFILYLLFYLLDRLVSSSSQLNGKSQTLVEFSSSNEANQILATSPGFDEVSESSLTPPSEIRKVYESEKDHIISFLQEQLRFREDISISHTENIPMFRNAMDKLLRLDAKGLFQSIIQDDSGYFLMIFLFSSRRHGRYIKFIRTLSLYNLKFPSSRMYYGNMRIVFSNFRCLMFDSFVNSGILQGTVLTGPDYELLLVMQIFWYRKLEPLGLKVLFRSALEGERRIFEELFHFLYTFPVNDPKSPITYLYRRLRKEVKRGCSTFALETFSLLSQHMVGRMKTLSSPEFLEDLGWLASRSRKFIIHFFYFLANSLENAGFPSTESLKDCSTMLFYIRQSIHLIILLDGSSTFIFGQRIFDSDKDRHEAVWLSHLILNIFKA